MTNPDAIWRIYPEGPVTENTILLYNGDWDILGDADRDLSPELVNFATMVLQDDEPIASVRSTFKIAYSVLTPFMPIDEAGAMRWYTRRELFGNRIWIVPVHLELANRWALFLITGLDVCRVTRCINVYVLGAVQGDKVEVQGVYRTLKTFLGMVHAQEPNQFQMKKALRESSTDAPTKTIDDLAKPTMPTQPEFPRKLAAIDSEDEATPLDARQQFLQQLGATSDIVTSCMSFEAHDTPAWERFFASLRPAWVMPAPVLAEVRSSSACVLGIDGATSPDLKLTAPDNNNAISDEELVEDEEEAQLLRALDVFDEAADITDALLFSPEIACKEVDLTAQDTEPETPLNAQDLFTSMFEPVNHTLNTTTVVCMPKILALKVPLRTASNVKRHWPVLAPTVLHLDALMTSKGTQLAVHRYHLASVAHYSEEGPVASHHFVDVVKDVDLLKTCTRFRDSAWETLELHQKDDEPTDCLLYYY
ncbi:hypothetical protein SPRG_12250 [Saprolegnia parasitica CBS 223.65]|uniref:Uncharacterized protein n=1 Tax=Saprolegnia parasitica (strain CBS 223.65) TaxID=695850 RepID=A0A067C658_SAPPC|nr:hypothetical protein SPRG_12250 [Saprolegnia parasitica CBS 223.65]KDO22041.1 hypothetical protein SPRG_12250 [Saprolegnia parasitica CBS 223.65]|eukprot:XP_012207284.1 hypothetical protein SPRG_12250 [Saprolegnia parasitica CBS 223.65]